MRTAKTYAIFAEEYALYLIGLSFCLELYVYPLASQSRREFVPILASRQYGFDSIEDFIPKSIITSKPITFYGLFPFSPFQLVSFGEFFADLC